MLGEQMAGDRDLALIEYFTAEWLSGTRKSNNIWWTLKENCSSPVLVIQASKHHFGHCFSLVKDWIIKHTRHPSPRPDLGSGLLQPHK